jgi:hypothetical protein
MKDGIPFWWPLQPKRSSTLAWLTLSILVAKTVAAAAEFSPYIKEVFTTVVVILETVEVCNSGSMERM